MIQGSQTVRMHPRRDVVDCDDVTDVGLFDRRRGVGVDRQTEDLAVADVRRSRRVPPNVRSRRLRIENLDVDGGKDIGLRSLGDESLGSQGEKGGL